MSHLTRDEASAAARHAGERRTDDAVRVQSGTQAPQKLASLAHPA
jgi:hypothetical protein